MKPTNIRVNAFNKKIIISMKDKQCVVLKTLNKAIGFQSTARRMGIDSMRRKAESGYRVWILRTPLKTEDFGNWDVDITNLPIPTSATRR